MSYCIGTPSSFARSSECRASRPSKGTVSCASNSRSVVPITRWLVRTVSGASSSRWPQRTLKSAEPLRSSSRNARSAPSTPMRRQRGGTGPTRTAPPSLRKMPSSNVCACPQPAPPRLAIASDPAIAGPSRRRKRRDPLRARRARETDCIEGKRKTHSKYHARAPAARRVKPRSSGYEGAFMSTGAVRLYNTMTQRVEPLEPFEPGHVRLYVCGLTTYDHAHAGHARTFVAFDVIVRFLRARGYRVTFVRNVTDVDDKILKRALEAGVPPLELSRRMSLVNADELRACGCLTPDAEPRVSESIGPIVALIEQLVAKDAAYVGETAKGRDVFFAVRAFPGYGKLSHRNVDDLVSGARVEPGEGKRDPLDFALWKASGAEGLGWESPWGRGRPGWHIECSAMAGKYLGETFDIHGGGIDLVFPHHENEIAQSESAHQGHPLANVWMHNGFLQVEGEKMAKRAGNFFTIRELLADWPGEVLRFNMLRTHYRQPIDFTLAGLKESWKTLERWYDVTEPLADPAPDRDFMAALRDDLNTPQAIASLHQAEPLALAGGLGFMGFSNVAMRITLKPKVDAKEIADAIALRQKARAEKNFAESDRIRDTLLARGIVLKDGPQGTTWEVKP